MNEPADNEPAGSEPRGFTPLGGETAYSGRIFDVRVDRFRHADGEEVSREYAHHKGAVAMVAYDDRDVWLVRQPREAVGEPALLEIPAGRLDIAGEQPLQAAQRELAEEIGLQAARWTFLKAYRSSVGFTDEVVHLFLAEELSQAIGEHDSGEDERIEIVRWPLSDLAGAIDAVSDSKTLIGLLLLERLRTAPVSSDR
jgi:8-oxo-dGTP pyrophosphatase MutT (NUDIX family)